MLLGFPSFVGQAEVLVDLSAFDREVGGWLSRLGEFDLPPLSGL